MVKNVGDKTKQGILWTATFNGIQFFIGFCSSIILARVLFPEDFGLMGLATIVIQFSRRLAQFGFSMALVRLTDPKPEHYDTVFIVNTIFMGLVTTALFFSSSYIAAFFNNDLLRPILMIISFDFTLKALFSVPRAILTRKLKFKELGAIQTIKGLVEMLSAVALALFGLGVWSLVIGNILGTVSAAVATYTIKPWFPRFRFRAWALKDVFSFGMWVFANKYLNFFVNNVDFFMIGKVLNATQLGYYERAFKLISMPRQRIVKRINRVLFPAYSKLQSNDERLINAFLKVTKHVALVTYPIMIWMFFVAPSLVTVLYGPKWKASIYPFQIMCFSGLLNTLSLNYNPVYMAKGWVSQRALIQFMYLLVLAGSIFYGISWGINGVAWAVVCSSVFLLTTLTFFLKRLLQFTLWQFFLAQKSCIILGFFQVLILVFFENITKAYFPTDSWQMLILLTIVSIASYLGVHLIFRFEDVDEILYDLVSEIKKFIRRLPFISHMSIFYRKV